MSALTLAQKLRTGHVKRWQIVRVAREQTLAEHMYRAYLITRAICQELRVDRITMALACDWALTHDLPEVITGDLATPIKRAMREAIPAGDPVKQIELSLDNEYRDLYIRLKKECPRVIDIVKIADLAEAVDFLRVEGMGTHAADVLHDLIGKRNSAILTFEAKYGVNVTPIFDLLTKEELT